MRKKGWRRYAARWISLAAIAFGLCSSCRSVYADAQTREGKVDVELEEYELDSSGKEVPYNDEKIVLPGDTVSKIPRITNVADPCYIRVKWEYTNDSKEEGITDENIQGVTDDWIKKEDYLYYKKLLKKGESVDLFQSVYFPWEWTEAHSLQKIDIPIEVEAIAEEQTTPDYEKKEPWNGVSTTPARVVKTGDEANIFMLAGILMISGMVLLVYLKKRGTEK